MKTRKYPIVFFLIVVCIINGMMPTGLLAQNNGGVPKKVEVIFTHDLHAHLEPFIAKVDGSEEEVGGFAKIKTFIDERRQKADELLVLDAGDFNMGTLYQTVCTDTASELRLMGEMGVVATTFGNHEFDYGMENLMKMLESAISSGDALPKMVICNIDWEKSLQGENARINAQFKKVIEAYGIRPYIIEERNGLRIAITGVFGKDALFYSPECTLSFKEPIEAVKEIVEAIKADERPDMIICLSHSGTSSNSKTSEDEQLAMQVPSLDLIVSGHSHSRMDKPIIYGDTSIVSCECYGKYCGDVLLEAKNERWQIADYQLVKMDASIPENKGIKEKIEGFSEQINEAYLKQYGYTKDQVLAYNPWEYPDVNDMYLEVKEQPFANLLVDAYLYKMKELGIKKDNEPMIAVIPMGEIRETFAKDKEVTVSNVYDAFSLGIGEDGKAGYPLIKVYLTGKELKTVAEIDASISSFMHTAQLFISGLSYESNKKRLLLNRVTSVSLVSASGEKVPVDEERLYPLVTDLHSGKMLGAIKELSYGLISLVPKDEKGTAYTDMKEAMILEHGKEIKAWVAIADYMGSFSKDGVVRRIPEYYATVQHRKNIIVDGSIGAVFSSPNEIILRLGGIVLIIIVVFVLLGIVVVKLIKKQKAKRK